MIKRLLVVASLVVIAIVAFLKIDALGALATTLLMLACMWLVVVLVMGLLFCGGGTR